MFFKKKLAQNANVLAFGFTENASLRQILIETTYFLAMSPYSGSVIYNGHVYRFLYILKIYNLNSKSKGVSKTSVYDKN
jgi:hypothetical protein